MKKITGEIIDCHIHPFISSEHSLYMFGQDVQPSEFVRTLKKAGISKCCGSVIDPSVTGKPCNFKHIRKLNREVLKFRDRYNDFFVPGVHIHPEFPDESCDELDDMIKEGVKWVGELVQYIHGYKKYAIEKAFPVYKKISDASMVLNVHPPENPADIDELCTEFPDMKVVLAHPGGGKKEIDEKIALMKKHRNLHLDISGTGIYRYGILRYISKAVGAERILFGTDFPICNPASYLQGLLFEKLPEQDLTLIVSGNFRRLTGIE